MIAGATISYWIGFHILVATLSCGFALFLSKTQGREPGLEFFSGYLIEGSLSVDNLFVFLLMFRSLRLGEEEQHRVLMWGVLGAIVMRAFFIAVGVSLLNRFAWISYIFGAFLLYAAIRLLRHKSGEESADRKSVV